MIEEVGAGFEPPTQGDPPPEERLTSKSCINCCRRFKREDIWYYYGARDVGPLCEACDQVVKTHTCFQDKEINAESARPGSPAGQQMADAAEMLWVVLANVSGGDWTKQSADWQEAAAQWRDNYFGALSDQTPERQHDAAAFMTRCHELGATDTDIVKHALEDQARLRSELAPMSIALAAAKDALVEARRTISVGHSVQDQIAAALELLDAL